MGIVRLRGKWSETAFANEASAGRDLYAPAMGEGTGSGPPGCKRASTSQWIVMPAIRIKAAH